MIITTNFLTWLQIFLFVIVLVINIHGGDSKFAGSGGNCRESERMALLQLKSELIDDDDDGRFSSWESITNCCEWSGAACDNRTDHVVALDLHGLSDDIYYYPTAPPRGKISPSLLHLPHLQYLDLSLNDFNGTTIPSFIGSLTKLHHLNLSYSNFVGPIPPHIGNLSALRLLDLSFNHFYSEETNLDWLAGSPSLQYLDLSGSTLEGSATWLQVIHNLTALKELHLSDCQLPTPAPISVPSHNSSNSLLVLDLSFSYLTHSSAVLHSFLNMSSSFTYIDFSCTSLMGRIPNALGNLMSLFHLDLSGSTLEGSATWLQVIHNLTALKELHLSYCQLPTPAPISVPSHNASNSLLVLDFSFTSLTHSTAVLLSFLNMSSSFTYIDFSGTSLKGSIPNALGNLASLSHLKLRYNSLKNSIPDALGNLTSLSYLDLSGNELQGEFPRPSTNSSSLTYLDLSGNKFNGQLPRLLTWLQDSTRLEILSLRYNLFSGSFPNMSRFTLLKKLYLGNNGLHGALLEGHIRLPNLEYLDLSKNKFEGRLPDLSTCQPLRVLDLSDNAFNGSLSESIEHLSKIESLRVGSNQFEGVFNLSNHPQLTDQLDLSFNLNLTLTTTPSWIHPVQFLELHLENIKLGPSFPTWLQKQNQLRFLDISNSGIFDTIPAWFWGTIYECYYLNMSHNQIYGVLPNFSSEFKELITIDLSSNEFNGSLPHLPPFVFDIDMSRNRFSGTILNFCNFKKNIYLFLDVSNNQLSGEIPQNCFMNLLSLVYLNLANNDFSGEIPTTNNLRCSVSSLHLRNNSFRGEIPKSLMNCSELRILDLGGNELSGKIPRWLGESMPKLGVLILKSNMFCGSLPPSICHLTSLQVLDISLNNITGSIPNCVNNFSALSSEMNPDSWRSTFYSPRNGSTELYDSASVIWKGHEETYINTLGLLKMIDLSSNELTGEIPHELTSLIGLVGLNLSRNNLVGVIPKEINELRNLDFLDLSRNNLSGTIPPTLSKLSHLGVLDLSFNNLWGRIPWDSHLQTFEASSFFGNPRLCGPPLLSRPCPGDEKPTDDGSSDDSEETFINRGFYMSMVLGLVVAFWVVFWTLFFNKWWNAWSMRICITVADWLYVEVLVNKRRLLRFFDNAS